MVCWQGSKIIVLVSSPEPKARWGAYRIGRPLSSVCMYVCSVSTFSNIFSSETNGPIEAKFHVALPWNGETKVYTVKILINLLLWNQKADDLETWYAASSAQVLPSVFK